MSVEWGQVIILAVILIFGLYVFGARTVLIDRLVYLFLVAAGVVLGLYPELSTKVANLIGIGRGADLLLYIFVLFSLFHYVSLASQMKRIEQQITAMARAHAIEHPLARGSSPPVEERPVESGASGVSSAAGSSPKPADPSPFPVG